MRAYSSLEALPPGSRAIAIGSFDGVHLGHRRVIERTIESAARDGLTSTVVTFEPHPMAVLRPELAPLELSTPARKQQLVAALGVDEMVRIRFDHAFSMLDHERFAQDVLAEALGAKLVIVGRNFHYGHRAQGSIETLEASGERLGFAVEPAPLLEIGGAPVSSSRIRPVTSSSMSSGTEPHGVAMTGVPQARASIITRPNGSGHWIGLSRLLAPPSRR